MAELLIAGCGAAGSFLALRALQLGLEPTLLRVATPVVTGIEILPASTARLLETLDLGAVLGELGAGLGCGLIRSWPDGSTDVVQGHALHVDRLRLREALLAEAKRRGARILDVSALPHPGPTDYVADATGQRAAWSRPVVRGARRAADLFVAGAVVAPGTGRLAVLDRGWAYSASDQATCTIGVIGLSEAPSAVPDASVRRALGFSAEVRFRFAGRRPAFVQWAEKPVVGRRLSVGDAAFHHDPIGGRGLAFALGSAFAAATTFATWRDDPCSAPSARAYYEDYVASERRRHLAFLGGEPTDAIEIRDIPRRLHWVAPSTPAALAVDGRVATGEVFTTRGGAPVRWAGGLDLARMREILAACVDLEPLLTALEAEGLDAVDAQAALSWALSRGLVEAAGPLRDAGARSDDRPRS